MTIISFINLKGGVGKTTCCANIAGEFARENRKVLVIDGDPQANLSTFLLGPHRYRGLINSNSEEKDVIKKTVYQIFLDAIEPEEHKKSFSFSDAIIPNVVEKEERGTFIKPLPHLDLLPSSYHFMQLENDIVNYVRSRYAILDIALRKIRKEYEYILIDCPPNIYTFTHNALYASDYFIIPTIPDFLSITGIPLLINRLNQTIKIKEEEKEKKVRLLGILINMFDKRLNVHEETIEEINRQLSMFKSNHLINDFAKILDPPIRQLNDIRKASANNLPVCIDNPRSNSKAEFMNLCSEIQRQITSLEGN